MSVLFSWTVAVVYSIVICMFDEQACEANEPR